MAGGRTEPLLPHDPRTLGVYELLGRLGEGGMGTVYLARTPAGVLVAVKVVRPDLAPGEEFRRRFRSEVARARQVPPFCTAEVLDADPDHDQPYLVVEYVDGPTLAHVVEDRGPLSSANLHSVAIGVATALTAIHGAGVIHRDLKPRNVLLAPGSPKVIDFGIARAMEATTGNTYAGQMVGTVAYMAPERFGAEADAPLTPAADVFAWGGVVAYAGTGRTPFGADASPATAARILTQPPDLGGLTGSLRDLAAHALNKDPALRPTARELLDLLVAGPSWPAATAAALADQPGLRAAAAEAQAVTGYASPPTAAPTSPVGYDEDAISTQPISTPPVSATAASGSPGEPPRAGRRWFLPVAVAILILAVVAGAVMVVLGLPPVDRNPAVAHPPPSAVAEELLIADDLSKPGYWQARTEADGKASCTFDAALVVQVAARGLYKCPGPQDAEPSDIGADVGVRLLTKSSCASIWFRFRQQRGYQVRVCNSNIYVGTHKGIDVHVLRTFPLVTPVGIGSPATRIGIRAVGGSVEVSRDGTVVGTVPLSDPDITGGRLVLGVYTDRDAPAVGQFSVAFSDVRILSLHR